jgi:hypothetical protein
MGISDGGILERPGRETGTFGPETNQYGKYFIARTRSGRKKSDATSVLRLEKFYNLRDE